MKAKRENNRSETAFRKEAVEVKAELSEEELSEVSGGNGSNSLFHACCSGQHFKTAILH
jgi:bacteriocin-like protein